MSVALLCVGLGVLYLYKALAIPLLVSIFLAFILMPLVDWLSQFSLPRWLVVSLLLCCTVGIAFFALVTVVPAIYRGVLDIIQKGPAFFSFVQTNVLEPLQDFVLHSELLRQESIDKMILEYSRVESLPERAQNALTTIWNNAPRVLGTLINAVMIPLFTFFFLKDYQKFVSFVGNLVPIDLRGAGRTVLERVDRMLRVVFKGQLIIAGLLGTMYVVGLALLGIPSAVVIGIVAGVCRVVPYLDVVVGLSLSLMSVFSSYDGFGQVVGVVLVFLLVQAIDGMVITPRILGGRVGLHPLIVIASILAFGDFFGFWGVLLAVPVVAVVKTLLAVIKPYYFSSSLYK